MIEIIDFINDSFFNSNQEKRYVYVLLLEDKNYYIGITNNLIRRFNQHYNGEGADWTKLHKPIKLLKVFEGDLEDERQETLRWMKKRGSKVRGSVWCKVEHMSKPPDELLEHFGMKESWNPFPCEIRRQKYIAKKARNKS
jgi:predicted GIY-YIG superfamily endonuclease